MAYFSLFILYGVPSNFTILSVTVLIVIKLNHTHIHKQTHCTHGTVYPHIHSQISMIAGSVFTDPDHDISWLKPYWWVRQSFSHMLGNSEYRTSIPLSGHCSPRGLTTLLIACLILETSYVQMTLRDPLLTM